MRNVRAHDRGEQLDGQRRRNPHAVAFEFPVDEPPGEGPKQKPHAYGQKRDGAKADPVRLKAEVEFGGGEFKELRLGAQPRFEGRARREHHPGGRERHVAADPGALGPKAVVAAENASRNAECDRGCILIEGTSEGTRPEPVREQYERAETRLRRKHVRARIEFDRPADLAHEVREHSGDFRRHPGHDGVRRQAEIGRNGRRAVRRVRVEPLVEKCGEHRRAASDGRDGRIRHGVSFRSPFGDSPSPRPSAAQDVDPSMMNRFLSGVSRKKSRPRTGSFEPVPETDAH